jgi:hypothetical protein
MKHQKKLLIILDLNGVLVHRLKASKEKLPQASSPEHALKPTMTLGGRKVIFRPSVEQLFTAIPEHVQLAIWTSAEKRNVVQILEKLAPEYKSRNLFEFTWFRDKCVTDPHDYKFCIKDLSKVWQSSSKWNEKNTVLVDDSELKCKNQPDNLLCVKEFKATAEDAFKDDEIRKLLNWIHRVSEWFGESLLLDNEFDIRPFIKSYHGTD